MSRQSIVVAAGLVSLVALGSQARAGTLASITIDGSYSDWAGVPVLLNDASDSSATDVADVQIANDAANLYLRVTYHTAVNPNAAGNGSLYLAFDTDNNVATGFNIYGMNVVGSEAGFSNDFPFDQRTGFNVGALSAGAAIAPFSFGNPADTTTAQEYAIPRSLMFMNDNQLVFGNSFTLMLWTDAATSVDATAGISYTFAIVPEPASVASLGLLALATRRRR